MALLHQASISPTKLEALSAWAPHRPWFVGGGELTILGAYRFDDPADEVGIETFLVRAGDGPVLQVPLTYRSAPLVGAERDLVTEMEHSVLGRRWVYDGCADPVYAAALATTALTGGRQAEMEIEIDGVLTTREATTFVTGSGVPGTPVPAVGPVERREDVDRTVLDAAGIELTVVRVVIPTTVVAVEGEHTLLGRWPDRSTPTLLAMVRVS
ncbi:CG0192-related protein [Nocardioides plantarum]|uniref:Maltokinase N-terminal cap domain-containing protein n=1 Tax=Nocardioides plantarum TaxID=29299 RepID=A0ABV5KFG2_9ACTN|nr:hypothetical protein [Nocardioides plantarum]